jgi:tripartite-type tricarboxylate transporter receptor subunit TctC
MKTFKFASALAALSMATFCATTQAQEFPSRQITIISSIGAGSPTDLECRALADYMKTSLKVPVVVEPKPGAGGSLAAQYVARATPDGHTLFCSGPGLTTFKILIKDLSFDPLKDLTPVSMMSDFVGLYLTNGQAPFKTMDELIAYAKANPGKLSYASAGRNSIVLSLEAIKRIAGIDMLEVPYPGTPQFLLALMRNDVQLVQAPVSAVKGQIETGALRPVLINGYKKSILYPTIPTLGDKGWDLPRGTWTGLFAPAGTPKAVVDKLAGEVARYGVSPESKKREQDGTIVFVGSTPEQFRQQVDSDAKRWAEIAASLGWKPE